MLDEQQRTSRGDVRAALDDLFPTGLERRSALISYSILLTLASIIASFGLYQDSVASIIGAMVVAPLGGAIIAVGAAIVMGRVDLLARSVIQVVLSAAWVVLLAYLVSLLVVDPVVFPPAVDARTAPGLFDLGVALAAGAAGAYVAARRTGADALPGVAIAVSLVPPLASVGISLELGRPDDAAGALLLFATNFAAIVLMALVVFVVTGAAPEATNARERRNLRYGTIAAVAAVVIVAIPLAFQAGGAIDDSNEKQIALPVVEGWLAGAGEIIDITVVESAITVTVAGERAGHSVDELAAGLAEAFGQPVDVTLEWLPVEVERASANP